MAESKHLPAFHFFIEYNASLLEKSYFIRIFNLEISPIRQRYVGERGIFRVIYQQRFSLNTHFYDMVNLLIVSESRVTIFLITWQVHAAKGSRETLKSYAKPIGLNNKITSRK